MGKASNKGKKTKKETTEDDVDYAAAADSFADVDADGLLRDSENVHADRNGNDEDDAQGSVGDEDEEQDNGNDDAGSEGGRPSDAGEDESDEDSVNEGEESEGSEDASGSFDGEGIDGDADEDDDNEDGQGKLASPSQAARFGSSSSEAEACTFDLRNLLAMNTHQVDTVALYKQPPKKSKALSDGDDGKTITIPGDSMPAVANDDALLQMATDGCRQLIAALWQLPVERSDAGPLVTLPGYEEVRIPRALVRNCEEKAHVTCPCGLISAPSALKGSSPVKNPVIVNIV
jgi:hypothetical protein